LEDEIRQHKECIKKFVLINYPITENWEEELRQHECIKKFVLINYPITENWEEELRQHECIKKFVLINYPSLKIGKRKFVSMKNIL
jgi:adenylate kinase family enzyme